MILSYSGCTLDSGADFTHSQYFAKTTGSFSLFKSATDWVKAVTFTSRMPTGVGVWWDKGWYELSWN